MPLQSTFAARGTGLCLLSLDAGGSRGISQLKVLSHLMQKMNATHDGVHSKCPCAVFDMIGGAGTGGFISILLVVLRLTVEKALEEFIDLNVRVLEAKGMEAQARTTLLKQHLIQLLGRHKINKEMTLVQSSDQSVGCKLVIPISDKHHISSTATLRNFNPRQGPALDVTILDAMMITLATPPLFSPTSIPKDVSTFKYVSGEVTHSNPTRSIIAEAYGAFGPEGHVACLLSIGCGHPGVTPVPDGSNLAKWNEFLTKVATNNETEAQRMAGQMANLRLYHRFSVNRGLELCPTGEGPTSENIITQTSIYLEDFALAKKVDQCSELLRIRNETASLEQLKYSGGETVSAPPLPPLTKTFVMRQEPWTFIEKAMLHAGGPRRQKMLLVTGIGGCGKTQLILKFIESHGDKFESTFFLDGTSESRIQADMIRNVRALGTQHSQKTFKECLTFLAQPPSNRARLIVYDNVDDPDLDLGSLMPHGYSCAIMITSRNHSIGELDQRGHLELDVMSMPEAVELLRYGNPRLTDQDATLIAQELGCLAIALTQARSYIYQTKCSGRAYLDRLKSSRDKLLARPVKHQRDMRYTSTYAAFDASFEKLDVWAQRLLRLLSFLHWSKIPLELIELAAKHHFGDYAWTYIDHGEEYHTGKAVLEDIFLRDGSWDVTDLDDMVVSVQSYSLATLSPGIDTLLLQMHPLDHGWVNSYTPEKDRISYQSAAILLLALGARNEYTPSAQYLASHVAHLSPIWNQLHVNDLEKFGCILDDAGLFPDALQLRGRVVSELEKLPNMGGTSLSDARSQEAMTHVSLGQFNKAEALQVQVLTLRKEVLGVYHPDTIAASNNLAIVYTHLGLLNKAEGLQREVLRLKKEKLGGRHLDTSTASNNLAITCKYLGRLKEAEELQTEVLGLRRELLGKRHLDTIVASSSLANTYQSLGRLNEAEKLQKEVLRLDKEMLGERHPDTIMASNNLAITYQSLGRLEEAEQLQREVLRLYKEVLGERHASTIGASSNLATTYELLGQPKEAERLQTEVLKLSKEILGERHPKTIMACNNLAAIYYSMGRLNDARTLQAEVLSLRLEILGERHPDSAMAMFNLAFTYYKLGDQRRCLRLTILAKDIFFDAVGPNHPHYQTCERMLRRVQLDARSSPVMTS